MIASLRQIHRRARQFLSMLKAAVSLDYRRTLFQSAYDRGFTAGRAKAHAEIPPPEPLTYRVNALPTPELTDDLDEGLYGPARFDCATVAEAMRDQVAVLVDQHLLKTPTDEQWAMILSDHPATCIAAGAGSGKSTTLVLRVVFMLEYLNIPDEQITVISFTRDACAELRHALGRVLGLWRPRGVSEAWLNVRVRTFHSLLYGFAKVVLPGRQFFELMPEHESEAEENEAAEPDIDNPMAAKSKANARQAEVLLAAYRQAYAKDEAFRADLLAILESELVAPAGTALDHAINKGRVWHLSNLDASLTALVAQTWQAHGWPFPGVVATPAPMKKIWGQHAFLANGYDPKLKRPIVLGFAPGLTDAQKDALVTHSTGRSTPEPFGKALAAKLHVLKNFSAEEYILIRSQHDLDRYLARHAMLAQSQTTPSTPPPVFPFKLAGEVAASPIHEALFDQGSFAESLGVRVPDLIRRFDAPRVVDTTVRFYRALARFWTHLEHVLDQRQLHTFNQAFLLLTQNASAMAFSDHRLAATRHLLVDEFQDISPLLANWMMAMQWRLVHDNQDRPVSVMAIGDDWQSIYGWRGSAPQLFIDFAARFPTHRALGAADALVLTANYRSVPAIIEDAKQLIDRVGVKVNKLTEAIPTPSPGDHGVVLQEYAPDRPRITPEETADRLHAFIAQQYSEACAFVGAKAEHVIVMTRRRKLRSAISAKFPAQQYPGLRVCTYHQAKGLEADVAILIEDCAPGEAHPFRNLAYRASGLYPTYRYDQATTDEAWRLAYVGVTRGRRRVFWLVPIVDQTVTAKTFKGP